MTFRMNKTFKTWGRSLQWPHAALSFAVSCIIVPRLCILDGRLREIPLYLVIAAREISENLTDIRDYVIEAQLGGPGVPVDPPPCCKPFLIKQPTTGDENDVTIWRLPLLWHSMTPPPTPFQKSWLHAPEYPSQIFKLKTLRPTHYVMIQ